MKRVGLLVGRERSFPEALIAEVNRRDAGVTCELARIEATRADRPPEYDVLVDRISHDVTCFQPVLKAAALAGVRVINDPFLRMADDKFVNVAVARQLGVKVPKTAVLPACAYGPDVTAESLRNLELVDWNRLVEELGLPAFLKPHWGGGWRDVTRVKSLDELLAAYHKSGTRTMMLQEEIRWTQYVRCLVIGRRDVRLALWDPRLYHHERWIKAAETMPPLSPELAARLTDEALRLNRALGYDMNTVEFAIQDGEPYAIDFMNSAPDFDISSLGAEHFAWVVEKMADLVVDAALGRAPAPRVLAIASMPRATDIRFESDRMVVELEDGRTLGIPLESFPSLRDAAPEKRENWSLLGGGIGIHWPEFDVDLSVAGLLSRHFEYESPLGENRSHPMHLCARGQGGK